MDKTGKLTEKLSRDYTEYRAAALTDTKETIFDMSYRHALCGEWQFFLEWKYDPDEAEWRDDENDEDIDTLLRMGNIFTELAQYSAGMDTFEFGLTDSQGYVLDGFLLSHRIQEFRAKPDGTAHGIRDHEGKPEGTACGIRDHEGKPEGTAYGIQGHEGKPDKTAHKSRLSFRAP